MVFLLANYVVGRIAIRPIQGSASDAHGHDDVAVAVGFVGEGAHLPGRLLVLELEGCESRPAEIQDSCRKPDIMAATMFRDPTTLTADLDTLEDIERASQRLVTQALVDFMQDAKFIFTGESDLQADIGEDITREALETVGASRIPVRLFGKMDYKRARYVFHPDYAIRQALFVDSKAEKAALMARVQTSQTSMRIRQVRAGQSVDVPGELPQVLNAGNQSFLTTTVFVKYFYEEVEHGNNLKMIRVACLPNGMLQDKYNPTAADTIWRAGPNAPTLGEEFRTRLSFDLLRQKAAWRVQDIAIDPEAPFVWAE